MFYSSIILKTWFSGSSAVVISYDSRVLYVWGLQDKDIYTVRDIYRINKHIGRIFILLHRTPSYTRRWRHWLFRKPEVLHSYGAREWRNMCISVRQSVWRRGGGEGVIMRKHTKRHCLQWHLNCCWYKSFDLVFRFIVLSMFTSYHMSCIMVTVCRI